MLRLVAVNTLFSSDVTLSLVNITEILSISRITLNKRLKDYDDKLIYISKKPTVIVFKESFIENILLSK